MDKVIVRGFNLKAIEILHSEISRMIEQNQLFEGNSSEIFKLSLWGENSLDDLSVFLGWKHAVPPETGMSKVLWAKELNPLFLRFSNKIGVYFKEELAGKELPLLSL